MGLSIKWDITYACNLYCKHCINGDYLNRRDNSISFGDFKKIIDNISATSKIDYIHFLGGEPTVRKDFIEICTYLDYKKIKFGFNTNTLKLNTNYIRKLMNLNYLDNIVISLEGPNEQINDIIRGKSVFKIIDRTLDNMKELGFDFKKVTINTVISKLNYRYLSALIEYCISKNIEQLDLLELIEAGNAAGSGLSLNYAQKLDALISIIPYLDQKIKIVPKFVMPMTVNYINNKYSANIEYPEHGCNAGISFIYINNLGNVYSCDRIRNYGLENKNINLIDTNFKDVWTNAEFSNVFKLIESKHYENISPCKECEYFRGICYPCPIDMKNIYKIKECELSQTFLDDYLYHNINSIYGPIRTSYNGDSFIIHHISTNKTFEFDETSYTILRNIDAGVYKNFNDIYSDYKDNISKKDIRIFLNYLKSEGIIEFGDKYDKTL